jgi:hypothetical protein
LSERANQAINLDCPGCLASVKAVYEGHRSASSTTMMLKMAIVWGDPGTEALRGSGSLDANPPGNGQRSEAELRRHDRY